MTFRLSSHIPEPINFRRWYFCASARDFQILDPTLQADFDALHKVRDADISDIGRDLADDKWVVAFEGDVTLPFITSSTIA